VNALLADPTAVVDTKPASTPASPDGAPIEFQPPPERVCTSCGAAMREPQDWCLQCGTGAPQGLRRGPGWRTVAAILGATTALVAGAAVASYAALNKRSATHTASTATVALTPPTSSTPGAATTPTAPGAITPTSPATSTPITPTTLPTTPVTPTTPGAITPSLPTGATRPPKIPLPTPTPSGGVPIPTTSTPTPTIPTTSTPTTTTPVKKPAPTPILPDTDAARTYNPYNYPATDFGDPSLTIDGDGSTGWTAQLNPAVAPRLAEGVVIDLKTARRVGALKVDTSTPGISFEVYGARGHTPPPSITDPAWTRLAASHAVEKTQQLKLHSSANPHRFFLVWIVKAPAASVGTAQAPGKVSLNELTLFPPA
jgi:hypothetical protein